MLRICLISLVTFITLLSGVIKAEAGDDLNDPQRQESPSSQISDVYYELTLFVSNEPKFSAVSKIDFSLKNANKPLSLVLKHVQVNSFSINGHKIYPNYDGQHLTLSQKLLNTGSNTLEISYSGTLKRMTG